MSYPFTFPEGQPVLTFPQARERLKALNYALTKNQIDMYSKKRAFRTTPIVGGGGWNYFDDLKAVTLYILQVEEMRSWQVGVCHV